MFCRSFSKYISTVQEFNPYEHSLARFHLMHVEKSADSYKCSHGPPPAKKAKGNPIITRYPPPPGYRGPNHPGVPYHPPAGWQNYGHHQPHNGFQQQPYSQPPYQPQFAGYFTPQATPTNGYPAGGQFSPQQSVWQPAITTPQSAPAPSPWHPPPSSFRGHPRRHNSAPFATPSQPVLDGNGDPLGPEDLITSSGNELETEFDGECYFSRHPDEVDPELSIGSITWKAPLPARRALPGTFKEAELEALAPRIEELIGEETVSDYFSRARREESLLSVRQVDYWAEMKDDLIFREFPQVCTTSVSLAELFANWRNRYDPTWSTRPPTPELSRSASRASSVASQMQQDGEDVLGDLETALQANLRGTVPPEQWRPTSRASSVSSHHSRANSIHSHHRRKSSTVSNHRALPPIRDKGQEDILAALGVTGSPKLVYETPGPAFGPRPSSAAGSACGQNSRSSSFSSAHGKNERTLGYIPEMIIDEGMEPNDLATPRPKKPSMGDTSRKRSYADAGPGAYEDDVGNEDETPRQKGKHMRVM